MNLKQNVLLLMSSLSMLLIPQAPFAADANGTVEPISARHARTYDAPTLDLRVEYFRDKPMVELDDYNGYGVTLDFTYPLNDVSQGELLLPLYTNGKGDYRKPGNKYGGRSLDIEGYAGSREFASLIYERQVPWLEDKSGLNLAWLA